MRASGSMLGRLVACALAVVSVSVGQALVASQAQAVPGLVRVTATSATDSSATKTVAAVCPAGKRVVGGGGDVVNGAGQVVLERLQPQQTATGERFITSATEDENGFSGSWRLTAYALCSDPLPGQQIVSGPQPPASDALQSTLTLCPGSQAEVGFGGRVSGGAGQVRLTDLFPFFDNPPSITFTRAREDSNGFAGQWSVTGYAVCADSGTGFTTVSALGPASSANKSVTVSCPAGTKVHSAGGQLRSDGAAVNRVVVDGINIDAQLSSVTVDGAEDQTATTDTWSLMATALCAP